MGGQDDNWREQPGKSSPRSSTPKVYNAFERYGMVPDGKKAYLLIGAPEVADLKQVSKIMQTSTLKHFEDSNPRNEEVLQYGVDVGDYSFREELAKFLNKNHRNPVNQDDLFINCGVSQGLMCLLCRYFQHGQTLFVEEPGFWNFMDGRKDSFSLNIVGIPIDKDGMKVNALEAELRNLPSREPCERYPYRAAVYVIPVHQNPTGVILSQDRRERLIKLAREYDLLIISDEVYSMLTYTAHDCNDPVSAKPPTRLFWYDKKSDPDYKGNVVGISSLSKILAPGLRVGWYEMPARVMQTFRHYFLTYSGGAWNQYTSGILAWAFRLGLVEQHLESLRKKYWGRFNRVHELVTDRLEKHGVVCDLPSGGFFMWITLPKDYSTDDLLKKTSKEVVFARSKLFFRSNPLQNSLRISISFYDKDILLPAVSKLCDYIEDFIKGQ